MKLDTVDELAFGPADHHLDLSQVAACELPETFGQPIKLQPMILPDTHQVAPVRVRLPTIVRTVIDPGEDWVVRVSDLYIADTGIRSTGLFVARAGAACRE